jgi:hypothetical protein
MIGWRPEETSVSKCSRPSTRQRSVEPSSAMTRDDLMAERRDEAGFDALAPRRAPVAHMPSY